MRLFPIAHDLAAGLAAIDSPICTFVPSCLRTFCVLNIVVSILDWSWGLGTFIRIWGCRIASPYARLLAWAHGIDLVPCYVDPDHSFFHPDVTQLKELICRHLGIMLRLALGLSAHIPGCVTIGKGRSLVQDVYSGRLEFSSFLLDSSFNVLAIV